MVQELKSLAHGLESFEMVNRPGGKNVLQSSWTFQRHHYPDGSLK